MLVTLLALLAWQSPSPTPPDTALLRLAGRTIVVFRSSLGAASPAERAATAARRLELALATGRDSVSLRPDAAGLLVLVGDQPVLTVTPSDVDSAQGRSSQLVAERAATQLRLAIGEERETRSVTALLTALALSLAATAAVILVIRLLLLGSRRVRERLAHPAAGGGPRIRLRGLTIVQPRQLVGAARLLTAIGAWGLGLVAAYLYATFVLTEFPWTRPLGERLGRLLLEALGRLALGAVRAVPSVLMIILIFIATRFAAQLLRSVFDAVAQRRLTIPGLHPDTAAPTRRIAIALLWLFAAVVAYPYVPGSGSAAFKGVSVFTGILITLGSAGLVGQAMSGLVLMYSRSYKVGDFVQAGGIQGSVVELGLLSTRLRTPKNELVTLPNNVVVASAVTDYTAAGQDGRPLLIYSSVTIGYDVPWRRVHELLVSAAAATEGVLKDPRPFVLQRALDDSYVEYQVNAPVDAARAAELPVFYSSLHANIQDTFAAAGVEIMSPSYHAVRDGNASTVPPERAARARAGAFRVDLTRSD